MTNGIIDSKKFLSNNQYAALHATLSEDNSWQALAIELLMTYGMRSGELLNIMEADLNRQSRSLFIRGTKGSRDREFPISKRLFNRLTAKADAECKRPEDPVFPISRFQLMRIWRDYQPCVGKSLHCLRHTAAVRIYQSTKDIQLVQGILGHKHLSTTLIYQQFQYTQDKYKEVFDVK